MRPLRLARYVAAVAACLTLGLMPSPGHAGFCFSEFRFQSPETDLLAGLLTASNLEVVIPKLRGREDALEYLAEHPGCCSIVYPDDPVFYEGFGLDRVSHVLGFVELVVEAALPKERIPGDVGDFFVAWVFFDRCGKIVKVSGREYSSFRPGHFHD